MANDPSLQHFLEVIMGINVTTMGGASAGILGSTSSRDDLVHNLKKNAIAFAQAYRTDPQGTAAEKATKEIIGTLRTLQLTNTLSMKTMTSLIDELEALLAEDTSTKR